MQFVPMGPDVPDALLQAHAEGRVVFFTGAGISRPAGLPGFKGLVNDVYDALSESQAPTEQAAFDAKKFDTVFDLLENRLVNGRVVVRQAIAAKLKPRVYGAGGSANQAALLKLSLHGGELRLVTTNFDRVFENAKRREGFTFESFSAPMLPVPKRSRWKGLVYLHGLLPHKQGASLDHLVVSSGDFGRAYLTEGWAARFAAELFREFVVCFVGYSIDDPVIRYMMDALAADRMLGEDRPDAFAFAHYKPGREGAARQEWEAKGVRPVLFEVDGKSGGFDRLTDTLVAWSDVHRDGVRMRESIIERDAPSNPQASSLEDDFVGRVIWALLHDSGLPAKKFARLDSAPPFEWLHAFSEPVLDQHGRRPSEEGGDPRALFSLLDRSSLRPRDATMHLASWEDDEPAWDRPLRQLVWWVVRYLGKPELLLWVVGRGARMHPTFREAVRTHLVWLDGLKDEERQVEMRRSPEGFPSPPLRKAWDLLIDERIQSDQQRLAWYRWASRIDGQPASPLMVSDLRRLLCPKIQVSARISFFESEQEEKEPRSLWDVFDWELALVSDVSREVVDKIVRSDLWEGVKERAIGVLQDLLRDGLELMAEAGVANPGWDTSVVHLPSIEPHFQNRDFKHWVLLIEVQRDLWLDLVKSDVETARSFALSWFSRPFLAFKRLGLFAASQEGIIHGATWTEWLLRGKAGLLWDVGVRREVLRLLRTRGKNLRVRDRQDLERAILAGPERDDEDSSWADREIWVRLRKLFDSGAKLGKKAADVLTSLEIANEHFKVSGNEREEFVAWSFGTGDPGFDASELRVNVPREREALVGWLVERAKEGGTEVASDWGELCGADYKLAIRALSDCAGRRAWPHDEWSEALFALGNKKRRWVGWRGLAPAIEAMPDEVFLLVENAVAFLLRQVAGEVHRLRASTRMVAVFEAACRRVISGVRDNDTDARDPVSRAINHPVGRALESLVVLWLAGKSEGENLSKESWELLGRICREDGEGMRNGRVILASRTASLFRLDPDWCRSHLLPRYSWARSEVEAAAAWSGFLRAPQLVPGLVEELEDDLLEAAGHYSVLSQGSRTYCGLLVHLGTQQRGVIEPRRLHEAVETLPADGRLECARALANALNVDDEAGRGERWVKWIEPFWSEVWPQDSEKTPHLAQVLARLITRAGDKLPDAFSRLRPWLMPVVEPFHVTHAITESDIVDRFPGEVLELLDVTIRGNLWHGEHVKACLDQIGQADAGLRSDPRFRRLENEVESLG